MTIRRSAYHETDLGVEDRYAFDYEYCAARKGWAQCDTRQDASCYGVWANPHKRQVLCYCEGDVTITRCDTDLEFEAVMQHLATFHREDDGWKGVDPGLDERNVRKWIEVGLGDLLHAGLARDVLA